MATSRSTKAELLEENEYLHQRVAELEAQWQTRADTEECSKEFQSLGKLMISSEDIGIVICDCERRLEVWNIFMEELTGLSSDEVLGKYAFDLLPHLPEQSVDELLERALAGETVRSPDTPYRVPQTGMEGWITGYYSPLRSADGDIIGVIVNVHDITYRKQSENILQERTYELGERVKELGCLYGASSLAGGKEITLEKLLLGTIELIPPAWQYPEITCARIIVEDREFSTENYNETAWKLTGDIVVHGEQVGSLEIGYLEDKPDADEGPFLKEERSLLNAITEQLGGSIEHIRAVEALQESKAQYQDLFNSAPVAYLSIRTDGSIKTTNRAASDFLGYESEELTELKVTDLYAEESKEKAKQLFERFKRGISWENEEVVYERKDGQKVHGLLSVNLIRDKDGQVLESRSVVVDITERRMAREALKASESRFRRVVEHSADGIVMIDEVGNIIEWNTGQERITGLKRDDMLGKPVWDVNFQLWPTDEQTTVTGERLKEEFLKFSETGQAQWLDELWESEIEHPHGTRRVIQSLSYPIATREGWMAGTISRDITVQRQRELVLRETQERYRELVDKAGVAIMIDDEEGDIVFFNDRFAELHGYPVEDMKEQSVDSLVHPDDVERVRRYHRQRMEGVETPSRYEFKGLKKDGSIIYLEVDVVALEEGDKIVGTRSYFWDVSERKWVEEALRESEERYRAIFEQAADTIVLVDPDTGELSEFNDRAYENLGYTRQEFEKLKLPDFEIIESEEEVAEHIQRILREGSDVFDTKHRTKDNEIRDIQVSSRAISLRGKDYIQSMWRDITEHKRFEEELKQSHEQLRMLSARIQSTREEERSNIAREIHDELGQNLTAIKMDLSWLRKELLPSQGALVGKTESVSKLVDDTIQRVKRISAELRPGLLDDLGIAAAVEWQAGEFEKVSGIECGLVLDPEELLLDQERSTAIFRVFQEILSNVARHSEATKVEVSLKAESERVILEVSDNGRGITKEELSSPTSLGILGMRERAAQLGGEFKIAGKKGKGTTVTLRFPLED